MNPDDIQQRVASAVAALVAARSAAGLSQYRLAEITGLSREAIRLIEAGQRVPSLHNFLLLCSALEVEPSAILDTSSGA